LIEIDYLFAVVTPAPSSIPASAQYMKPLTIQICVQSLPPPYLTVFFRVAFVPATA
jgi:hypothetical protein